MVGKGDNSTLIIGKYNLGEKIFAKIYEYIRGERNI